MAERKTGEGLNRVIGVTGLAATVVNNTIGAGIYALPAIVSLQMGAAGILDYAFCGLMLVAIMLCYAEIGSKVSASGGSYIYVEKAFGPFAGFIINWLFFVGWGILGSAALMNAAADSLSGLFPVFSNPLTRALFFFIILGSMVWINVRGAKQSMRVLEYLTLAKILPLAAIIIFGFGFVKMHNLRWQHMPSIHSFAETALVLFYAFAGFETSLGASGEIKNPKRTIPLGILLGAAMVFGFYILIQIVAQGALGDQMSAVKNGPLAAVAGRIIGPVGGIILLIAAIVSSLGTTGGDVLATPRLLFAGAIDGLFPRFLAKVHPKFATPYWAVIIYAGLIFISTLAGGFSELAVMASGALLIIYLSVILAMLKFRIKKTQETAKTFKAPGGLFIPAIAIAAIIWLLVSLKYVEKISTLIFVAVICVIYFLMRFFQKKRVGPDVRESILPVEE